MLALTSVTVVDESGKEHVLNHPAFMRIVRTNEGAGRPVAWAEIIVQLPATWDKTAGTRTPTISIPGL